MLRPAKKWEEALGKCEVCSNQATSVVRDIFETIPFDSSEAIGMAAGGAHRFCDEHYREPKIIQLREGPLLYAARMGK